MWACKGEIMKTLFTVLLVLAMAATCFASTVTLQWDANVPTDAVTGYNLYQDGKVVQTVTATTATIPNVTGVAHTFYVTAVNLSGESLPSNTVSMSPVPGAPTGTKITITILVTP
jgi:hypothetical protein